MRGWEGAVVRATALFCRGRWLHQTYLMGGSGREREKEREVVVKAEGEHEGVEEQKVRNISVARGYKSDKGWKCSRESTRWLALILH